MGRIFDGTGRLALGIITAGLGVACTGHIIGNDRDPAAGTEPGPPSAPGAGALPQGDPATGAKLPSRPGPMPLRRLTRDEYNNTLRDLVGDSSSPGSGLPDDRTGSSTYLVSTAISANEVMRFMEAAERVGAALLAAPARLSAVIGCDPIAVGADLCSRRFISGFGRRAFRRPLDAAELEELVALFKSTAAAVPGRDFHDTARVVIQAMLQSPSFLYHWEAGPEGSSAEGGLVKLSSHEVASRLSYLLWTTMPDQTLFMAADTGRLQTPQDVEAQARRMISDARFSDTARTFHFQWLDLTGVYSLEKDAKAFPEFNAALATAMAEETGAFVSDVLGARGDGRLATLLSSPRAFVNQALSAVYGKTGVTGPELRPVDLDPAQRAGLLTRATFLSVGATASQSHPVKRGLRILDRLLCLHLPAPPDDVPPVPPPMATLSTRDRFAEHAKNPCASACHGLIDPLGFAFESYDAIGRYRTQDGGKEVDSSGSIRLPDSAQAVSFRNAIDLSRILAGSDSVTTCVARQWFRYSLGRDDVDGDQASFATAYRDFSRSGGDIRELLVALTKAPTFLYRAQTEGEVLR